MRIRQDDPSTNEGVLCTINTGITHDFCINIRIIANIALFHCISIYATTK